MSSIIAALLCAAALSSRESVMDDVFDAYAAKRGSESIRESDIERFESNLPWFGRVLQKRVLGGSVAEFLIERCGENGVITRESAKVRTETCMSKDSYVNWTERFLRWGYSNYV